MIEIRLEIHFDSSFDNNDVDDDNRDNNSAMSLLRKGLCKCDETWRATYSKHIALNRLPV